MLKMPSDQYYGGNGEAYLATSLNVYEINFCIASENK